MSDFQPGKPMFSAEQTEAAIVGHFNRGLPEMQQQTEVQQQEQQEEVVQLSKADYDELIALRQRQSQSTEQSATQQQTTEEAEHFDPMKALDELFSYVAETEDEGSPKELEPEVVTTQQTKSQEAQQIDRVKEYTMNFYGEVGRIAESKYGLSQKQAIDIVAALTPDEIAQVAYAKITTQRQQATSSLPKPVRMNPPKTISGGQSATLPTNGQQEAYQRKERNPFTG